MITSVAERIRLRSAFFAHIREFFACRNVLEVDTPQLVTYGVSDVHLHSLNVAGEGYLITSPEYAMKKLLAQGSGDIYQLSHVFRGEECGHKHLQEFMLLEWYRIGWDYQRLMQEVAELISHLLGKTFTVTYQDYASLFADFLHIDIFNVSDNDLLAQCVAVVPEAGAWQLSRLGMLDMLFTQCIEPHLGKEDELVFVQHYLPEQAALARVVDDHKGRKVAARFEAYINGLELCNGFQELTDSSEQRQRFLDDNAMRKQLGLPEMAIDEDFLTALDHLPECAGVAVGIDRLLMLKTHAQHIQEIQLLR